ncbi:MAG: glutaminyl-peptide cyclotransferase, partial [Pseudonocardia sp.]|nr:glutaminyl-peptide cyclotransferase [Pseudonocardia sp.]
MPSPPTRALVVRLVVPPVAALALLAAGCAPSSPTPEPVSDPGDVIAAGVAAGVPVLRPVVLGTLPHDTSAWTEGLEIDGGSLFESTGLPGRSRLTELDPNTGRALRSAPLPDRLYGEGITVLGTRIWQLTWQDGVALRWDRVGLTPVGRVPWTGEGWGLCHLAAPPGPDRVVASDGSDRLRLLSGADLAPLGTVGVRIAGRPVSGLNELECTAGVVWANVYQTDWLVRIDPASGAVTAVVDAAGLLSSDQRAGTDVLNGIAHVPGTDE